MNSGKIHDVKCTSNVDNYRNKPAVLVLGNIETNTEREDMHATFNMYGGYIKSEWGSKVDTVISGEVKWRHKIACKCIQPRGSGAVVNMFYGNLDSFHYCISGQGTGIGDGTIIDKDGDTVINIEGGYLIGGQEPAYDDDGSTVTYLGYNYTPLFFPQSGTVNISGANITGPSCIDAKAGNINITGGVFNATKDPYDETAKAGESGSTADGSVLFMEANGFYAGGVSSATPLNIKVSNATMTSKTGYIAKCSYYKNSKGLINKASVTFDSGTFNYKLDKYTTDLPESIVKEYFTCSINGGTWNKVA